MPEGLLPMPTSVPDSLALRVPPEMELAAAIPPAQLELLSEQALDQLPYGVIVLDREGTVVRYNLAESRFARLDRSQVIGKSFFGRVAPCTATPDFMGRFRTLVETGTPGGSVAFSYVFDFKFGAQQVDIELILGTATPRVLVLVNRKRFMPMRSDLPEGFAAPLQSELALGEQHQGVLRGPHQERLLSLPANLFEALRTAGDRLSPDAFGLITAEWGFQWGRLAVVDLETRVSEEQDKMLRELPMREVMDRLGALLAAHGLGRLTADFGPARDGIFVLELERSALAEAVGLSETPRCDLLSGYFRALFTHLAHKLLVVREVCCAAQGYDRCAFIVAARERLEALDAAIAEGGHELPAVLEALRGGQPGAARV